jgi:predicted DNA binding CopG/RHH family protein
MVGRSKDPKGTRITVRISDNDMGKLQAEARRRNVTVGAVVRFLIREHLHASIMASQPAIK